jgi:hypothetical protein
MLGFSYNFGQKKDTQPRHSFILELSRNKQKEWSCVYYEFYHEYPRIKRLSGDKNGGA